jgi:hypothetical protein
MRSEIISIFRAHHENKYFPVDFDAAPALNSITTTLDASLAQSRQIR